MTDTTVEPAQGVPAPDAEQSPSADLVRTIRASIEKVNTGKATMADLFAAVITEDDEDAVKVVAAPAPTSISDRHRVLLTRLPEVFGKVNPDVVRSLSEDEINALSEERLTIEGLLDLLTSRKEKGIREIIANHFDRKAIADKRATEDTPRDKNGHLLTEEVEPTAHGRKFTRELRETKPSLSGAALLEAYERGDLTREEYLSCTRATRVYDEARTRDAIKRNPMLLMRLRPVLTKGGISASVYHRPHKG